MRQRHQDTERPIAPANDHAGDAADAGEQRALHARSAALLAAADEAINRALSRNSAEFLAQNRQSGGQ